MPKSVDKPLVVILASMIVVGALGSFGLVIREWTMWTTTTLVDLDKRSAIMATEMKHLNRMVAQNHEMLKEMMESKASYDNITRKPETTDIHWTEK